jgi:hypothetical protein
MTAGMDMSPLFPVMTSCANLSQDDLALKKALHLYLSHYAPAAPDLALLAINQLHRDCADQDPIVRGLALRCLCSLRVPNLLEYLVAPVAAALDDRHPYVRRPAVLAVLKIHRLLPLAGAAAPIAATSALVSRVRAILSDADTASNEDPQVVSNALHVVLATEGADALRRDRALVYALVNRMRDFSEWSQCAVLELVAHYVPESGGPDEVYALLGALEDRLSHVNSAVAVAAVKAFLHLTLDMPATHQQVLERVREPLKTLLGRDDPATTYAVLCHARLLVRRAPFVFEQCHQAFYWRAHDPWYVRQAKAEALAALATPSNAYDIVTELGEYVRASAQGGGGGGGGQQQGARAYAAREAVKAIGRVALAVPDAAGVAERLLGLLDPESQAEPVVAEALLQLRDLVRRFPDLRVALAQTPAMGGGGGLGGGGEDAGGGGGDDGGGAPTLRPARVADPEARGALVWLLGECSDAVPAAPYLLEELVAGPGGFDGSASTAAVVAAGGGATAASSPNRAAPKAPTEGILLAGLDDLDDGSGQIGGEGGGGLDALVASPAAAAAAAPADDAPAARSARRAAARSGCPFYARQPPSVRLALLTACAKSFFRRPAESRRLLGRVLASALADANPDVRDRALLYWRLLRQGGGGGGGAGGGGAAATADLDLGGLGGGGADDDDGLGGVVALSSGGAAGGKAGGEAGAQQPLLLAERVIFGGGSGGGSAGAGPAPLLRFEEPLTPEASDRVFEEFNSLSVLYQRPASAFCDAGGGYHDLEVAQRAKEALGPAGDNGAAAAAAAAPAAAAAATAAADSATDLLLGGDDDGAGGFFGGGGGGAAGGSGGGGGTSRDMLDDLVGGAGGGGAEALGGGDFGGGDIGGGGGMLPDDFMAMEPLAGSASAAASPSKLALAPATSLPRLDPADFQRRWRDPSSSAAAPVAAAAVPPAAAAAMAAGGHAALIAHMASRGLSCMASGGAPPGPLRYYFYAQQQKQQAGGSGVGGAAPSLLLVEVVVTPASGSAAVTVKAEGGTTEAPVRALSDLVCDALTAFSAAV